MSSNLILPTILHNTHNMTQTQTTNTTEAKVYQLCQELDRGSSCRASIIVMRELIRETAGVAMALCFMFCYLPQIMKIVKTKSSKDVSLSLIFMCMGGYTFGLLYMFLTNFALWFFLNYAFGLVMSSVLIYICFKYKK